MTLDNQMERLGRILAADQGLKVHVRGAKAYSTPGKVNIPNLRAYSMLGPNAKTMLHGLLDHETAHAAFTDHECMEAAHGNARLLRRYGIDPERAEKYRKHLPSMFNAIEDGWIEQKQGRKWPGARENLMKKNRWFWEVDTGVPAVSKRLHTEKPIEAYALAVCMVTRKALALDELLDVPKVGEMLDHTRDLIERVDSIDNSADALRLSLDILERLSERFEEEPEPEPEPEPDDSEQCDNPEDGDSEDEPDDGGDGEGGGEGDTPADGEDEGDDSDSPSGPSQDSDDPQGDQDGSGPQTGAEDEDGGDSDGAGSEDGPADDADTGDGEDSESDAPIKGSFTLDDEDWNMSGRPLTPEDSVDLQIKQALRDTEDLYLPFSHEWDIELDLQTAAVGKYGADALREVERDAEVAESPLIQAFEAALRAQREMRPIPGCDEGEVDPTLLASYALGAAQPDEIFLQYAQEDDRDCAVSILVDCSGSMGSENKPEAKSWLAKRAVYAMSLALQQMQIPHEVLGFTCTDNHTTARHLQLIMAGMVDDANRRFDEMRAAMLEAQKRGTDMKQFKRDIAWGISPHLRKMLGVSDQGLANELLVLPVHSVFKDFANDDLRALALMTGIHGNMDGEAVMWAARRLAARPEPRRVLFVLSDGEPSGAETELSQKYLREVVPQVIAAGIETHGIGMATDAVEHYYPSSIVVQDMDDLADKALTHLIEVLTSGRQEHQWTNVA